MPNSGVSVSATFTQTPPNMQSLFTGVDSGQGTISPNCPSGCSEAVGSSVRVAATPSSGWQFSSWSTQTGISCSNNPCTFSMPHNAVTLKATFITPITNETETQTSTQSSINGAQTVTVTQSPPPTTITNSVTVTQLVTQMQTVTQTLLVSNSGSADTNSLGSSKVSTSTLRSSTSTVAKRERNGFYFPESQDITQWWTAILLMLSGVWLILRFPRYRTGGLAIISKLAKVSGRATSKP
jgi:hypothetical protein